MVDPNTMTDYAKMKKIIFLDKLQGDRKSVLKEIINQGYIWAELRESFPAEDLVDPDLFPSLLYYYGMLTIIGKRGWESLTRMYVANITAMCWMNTTGMPKSTIIILPTDTM